VYTLLFFSFSPLPSFPAPRFFVAPPLGNKHRGVIAFPFFPPPPFVVYSRTRRRNLRPAARGNANFFFLFSFLFLFFFSEGGEQRTGAVGILFLFPFFFLFSFSPPHLVNLTDLKQRDGINRKTGVSFFLFFLSPSFFFLRIVAHRAEFRVCRMRMNVYELGEKKESPFSFSPFSPLFFPGATGSTGSLSTDDKRGYEGNRIYLPSIPLPLPLFFLSLPFFSFR